VQVNPHSSADNTIALNDPDAGTNMSLGISLNENTFGINTSDLLIEREHGH
jgi:hypothetical protein